MHCIILIRIMNKKKGSNALGDCRGYGCVMGTCDAARERETSKELVNLLTQAIEFDQLVNPVHNIAATATDADNSTSVHDLLMSELKTVKTEKKSICQDVVSINTGIKGIVLIKINRPDICPLSLVRSIFARVQNERLPVSKHVVRIVPLQRVFFPDENELEENARDLISTHFQGTSIALSNDLNIAVAISSSSKRKQPGDEAEDNVDDLEGPIAKSRCTEINESQPIEVDTRANDAVAESDSTNCIAIQSGNVLETVLPTHITVPVHPSSFPRKFVYTVQFKARNHNVLEKQLVYSTVNKCMPTFARVDRKHYESVIIVEALKNICGLSIIDGLNDLHEFNLRKFQLKVQEPLVEPPPELP